MPEEMLETEVDTYAPTPEELGKHFSAMDDSVWLINSLKESPREDQTAEEAAEEIGRNVAHIGIMLSKPFIQNSGRDLSAYVATQPAA